MSYINTATGAYPLSAADVRADFPNTSFPDGVDGFELAISREGYEVVQPTDQPTVDYTKNVSEGQPKATKGVWQQVWVVSDATAQEIADRTAKQSTLVRQERNTKLSDCDWTQLPDAPVDKSAWTTYRQALRDVTKQSGFPWQITWPVEP